MSAPTAAQESVTGASERLAAWERRLALSTGAAHHEVPWRALGPRFCGGRIETVDCPPDSPGTIYCAVGAGGVWKSEDGGLTWRAIFADQPTFAVGDLEVSRADPNTIWVGTGEAHLSGTSYDGLGVFRSTDAGETWTSAGLLNSRHIGKIVSHPTDPDLVYAACIGGKGRNSGQRGVYRSTDAGANWERLVHAEGAAFIDLVMDPTDPTRLWAASWDRGGNGQSGVWRSTDAGDTWERLAGGLLEEQVGRVAVDVCAADPNVVYALMVDHSPPGGGRDGVTGIVYRSDDGGDTWARTHEEKLPTYVGWDFCDVRAVPDDPDQVFVCGFRLLRSEDGGATWVRGGEEVQRLRDHTGEGMHLDMHDLWIDPQQPDRMLLGTDGGLYISWDRARSYLHLNDLPIAEFYKLHLSGEETLEVWGGTQDNASLITSSSKAYQPGRPDPWEQLWLDPWAGGDGFATFPDPFDPELFYYAQQQGDLKRARRGNQRRARRVKPRDEDLRFTWDTPYFASPHTEGVLFCASQFVHRSEDRGDTWTRLGLEPWGGPILSLNQSLLDPALLAAGAGGGQVQITRNGGGTWTHAAELPPKAVRDLVLSRHAPKRLYVVQSGAVGIGPDRQAYLHRTEDLGQTWSPITGDLPPEPCNALAEDPRDSNVLYLGTDLGVWVSTDAGAHWVPLGKGLPTCAVLDLAVHGPTNTLVAATHGLSVFALDVSALTR